MCAILDASITGELFRREREPIPDRFFRWMNGPGRLVVGGKQWRELLKQKDAELWLRQGIAAGRVRKLDDHLVEAKTAELKRRPEVRSNDPHVLAVALIGKARLLYANDPALETDFTNTELIASPSGRVYTSRLVKQGRGAKRATNPRRLTEAHKALLGRRDLCAGCD